MPAHIHDHNGSFPNVSSADAPSHAVRSQRILANDVVAMRGFPVHNSTFHLLPPRDHLLRFRDALTSQYLPHTISVSKYQPVHRLPLPLRRGSFHPLPQQPQKPFPAAPGRFRNAAHIFISIICFDIINGCVTAATCYGSLKIPVEAGSRSSRSNRVNFNFFALRHPFMTPTRISRFSVLFFS